MILMVELPNLLMKSKIKYEVSSHFSSNYCGGTAIDILLGPSVQYRQSRLLKFNYDFFFFFKLRTMTLGF